MASAAEKVASELGRRLESIGATPLPDDGVPLPDLAGPPKADDAPKVAKAPALKLFVNYKEGDDATLHMATKFVVPKGWRAGPVSKLLSFCVETYNKKHPSNPLDAGAVHLEVRGESLGLEEVVEAMLKPRDEVLLVPGAPQERGSAAIAAAERAAAAEAKRRADAEEKRGKVKCLNHGCGALFDPSKNDEGACAFHLAPPFVKGGYKGWSCCNPKPTMDWEEFSCFPCCQTGRHSAVAPPPFVPPAAAPAPAAVVDSEEEEDDDEAAAAAGAAAVEAPAKFKVEVVRGDDDDFKCQNNGCGVMFWKEENFNGRCKFHRGAPEAGRAAGTARWSCCPDIEVARGALGSVPGCKSGPHWSGEGVAEVTCEPCRWEGY